MRHTYFAASWRYGKAYQMSVPAISPVSEIGANSYMENLASSASRNQLGDTFHQNFLNVIFSNKQNLMSSSSYSQMIQSDLMSEKYREYKKQFRPTNADETAGAAKSDSEKLTNEHINEYSNKISREIELATMNQLVFSVSTRFGSAINQLVRGQ